MRVPLVLYLSFTALQQSLLAINFTFCFEGDEYLFVDTLQTFAQANATCKNSGPGTFLARISSEEEYDAVLQQVDLHDTGNFWVGVEGRSVNGDGDTRRFFYVDGTSDEDALGFIHVEVGNFPWTGGNPDNRNGENCVNWQESNNRWNDLDCSVTRPFLCRRPCIIDAPTNNPTVAETVFPESQPVSVTDVALISVAALTLISIIGLSGFIIREKSEIVKLQHKMTLVGVERAESNL